jgi:hypothetical protein
VDTAGGSAFSDTTTILSDAAVSFIHLKGLKDRNPPPVRPDRRDGSNFVRCRAEAKCGGVNMMQLAVG